MPGVDQPRTAQTWWLAGLLAVVLGLAWALLLAVSSWVWFLSLPGWLLAIGVSSSLAVGMGIHRPRALAYGVGLLGSVPIALGVLIGVIALASAFH